MTHETIATGYVIGAVSLLVLGAVVLWFTGSHFYGEYLAWKAEQIITKSPEARRQRLMVKVSTPTQKNAGDMDDLWAELLATPRIPLQRDRSDWTGGAS